MSKNHKRATERYDVMHSVLISRPLRIGTSAQSTVQDNAEYCNLHRYKDSWFNYVCSQMKHGHKALLDTSGFRSVGPF
jgi:hypothetical protein